jgi:biopolymer transport protein ExbD
MARSSVSVAGQPLGEMNTTPLIDVMLVLLVMLIFTLPTLTHSLDVDLPRGVTTQPDAVKNSLVVTNAGAVLWNGTPVGDAELNGLLSSVRAMRPEPEVQFRPEANASYDRTARVLQIVKASRITRFGFVDNEKYRSFSR